MFENRHRYYLGLYSQFLIKQIFFSRQFLLRKLSLQLNILKTKLLLSWMNLAVSSCPAFVAI